MHLKRLRINLHMACLFALIVAATVLRFVLISYNWPTTNSDEGNMGLLAMHVAFNGDHPTFFYGLPYMGPFQGYVAALLFRVFGVSLHTLRLALLLMFPLFLVSMYFLTRLLYTRGLALFTVLLLTSGSKDLISMQLKAVGEYAELELFAALISLLAAWLVLSSHSYSQMAAAENETGSGASYRRMRRRAKIGRLAVYGVLGLVVGVALWVDFLILPFVATATLLLLLFCRRELRSWLGVALLLGLIVGMMPLLVYNVTAPLSENSLATLWQIHHGGADEMAAQHLPWIRELFGAAIIGVPMLSGLNPRCNLTSFPFFGSPGMTSLSCTTYYSSWALGFFVLGILSALLAVVALWKLWRNRVERKWTFEQRQEVILHCARLMILSSVGLTILAYIISPTAAVSPETSARYLMCIVIAAPALLWPLWNGLGSLIRQSNWRAHFQAALRGVILLYITGMFFIGTIRTFEDMPVGEANYAHYDHMVQSLLRIGATRIYSDYWTCNNLTFRSQEQIICAALDDQLQPGFDRYLPYRAIVKAAPDPVYVLAAGTLQERNFEQRMRDNPSAYQRFNVEGYVIYQKR